MVVEVVGEEVEVSWVEVVEELELKPRPQLSDGQHRCEPISEPADRDRRPTAGWTLVDWSEHSVFWAKYNVACDLFHPMKFERESVLGPINQQVNRIIKIKF